MVKWRVWCPGLLYWQTSFIRCLAEVGRSLLLLGDWGAQVGWVPACGFGGACVFIGQCTERIPLSFLFPVSAPVYQCKRAAAQINLVPDMQPARRLFASDLHRRHPCAVRNRIFLLFFPILIYCAMRITCKRLHG